MISQLIFTRIVLDMKCKLTRTGHKIIRMKKVVYVNINGLKIFILHEGLVSFRIKITRSDQVIFGSLFHQHILAILDKLSHRIIIIIIKKSVV